MQPALIVSGFNRSGTSLMMDTCRRALGDEAVYGAKFPQQKTVEKELERRDWENEFEHKYRCYLWEKYSKKEYEEKIQKSLDANPNGFYECAFTLRGMKWCNGLDNILKDYRVIKIVAQALPNTNPHFVDRVILMLRNPREIARSFERIGNGEHLCEDEYKRQAVSLPMPLNYIIGMAQAVKWITKNDVTVLPVPYDQLMADPDKTLESIGFFTNADFSNHNIQPKQYRAKEEAKSDDPLWQIALSMYHSLQRKDWQHVLELRELASPYIRKEKASLTCARCGLSVSYHQCLQCYNGNQDMIENYKANAEQQGIDWQNEPCGFECGFAHPDDLQDGHKSIDESIKDNHWR